MKGKIIRLLIVLVLIFVPYYSGMIIEYFIPKLSHVPFFLIGLAVDLLMFLIIMVATITISWILEG